MKYTVPYSLYKPEFTDESNGENHCTDAFEKSCADDDFLCYGLEPCNMCCVDAFCHNTAVSEIYAFLCKRHKERCNCHKAEPARLYEKNYNYLPE